VRRSHEWQKWALKCVRSGRPILRLSLERHIDTAMHAMVIQPAKAFDEVERLGIIWYNNQPNPAVSISRHAQLQYVVCNDVNQWDSFLSLRGPVVKEWETEASSLCMAREHFHRDGFITISTGSFLAMEYIARFCGMIHQAANTSKDADESIVLGQADHDLERLLAAKRSDLASLAAGL
jgi:hypothetical protein